jgi:hypothetical protein
VLLQSDAAFVVFVIHTRFGVGYKFEPVAKEGRAHTAERSQGADLASPTIRTAALPDVRLN